MPRNTLRNLDAFDQPDGPESAAATDVAAGVLDRLVIGGGGASDAPEIPEELRTLLDERKLLEQRMSSLMGGTASPPGWPRPSFKTPAPSPPQMVS